MAPQQIGQRISGFLVAGEALSAIYKMVAALDENVLHVAAGIG